MLVNAGKWDELAEQCKRCENLRTLSLHMDGNNTYGCGKYPLLDSNEICPKFKEMTKEIEADNK